MGYTIPGADFIQSDQLKINVGASIGASTANAISSFTRAWQANAAKTEKLLGVKTDFRNGVVMANNATAQAAIKKGITSGTYKKGTPIFEQWSEEVVKRGQDATDAQMKIRFGDLDPEQEKEQLAIMNGFTSYNDSSLTNMGRYTSDVLASNNKDNGQFLTGDIATGQYMSNLVTMKAALGGNVADNLGEGATATRKLIVEGDENIISSSVSIPKNSNFIKNMNTGNNVFKDIIAAGIENKTIIEDGENYVFNQKINMGVYGTEGGPDFLVDHSARINQSGVLQNANFLDKDHQIKDTSYLGQNKEGFEKFSISKNTPNNNFQTTTLEVLDMHALGSNKAFLADVKTEVNTLLRPGRSPRAIASDLAHTYKTGDIESFKKDFPGLQKYNTFEEFFGSKDEEVKSSFVNNVIQESMFRNIFQDQKTTGNKDGVNFISRQLDEKKDAELMKYLTDNNAKNRLGEDYKAGDFVYGREIIKSEKITKPASISYNEKVYNNLQTGVDESILFAALTETPAKSKIMYTEKDNIKGTYVMQEGFPTGTALKPKALDLLFKP